MTTTSTGSEAVTWTYHLEFDFNDGSTEAGFYEVVLDRVMEGMVHQDSKVTIGSRLDQTVRHGKVRCIIALVELTDDLMTGEPLP
jgi:hypothetical protein